MSGFRRLWAGTAASNLADGVVVAAAPLLAASLTRDPLLVSGLVVAQQFPWFVFTLFAGVIVDRFDRRLLLVSANILRAIALGALTVGLAAGLEYLALLYGVVFALGVAETVIDNASLAVLPRLVGRDRLEWANGRIFATQSVLNELVGPPVGAMLFAVAATLAFLLGSAAFAAAALAFACLPRTLKSDDGDVTGSPGVVSAIGEGLRWFWGNRLIRTVAIMAGVVNLFDAATFGVLVLLATGELGLGAGGYGLLLASAAAGGIVAGLVAERFIRRLGSGPAIFFSNLLPGVGFLVLALASRPVLAGIALALISFAATIGNVVVITLRQASIPDHLLGRVSSAYRLIALGALPLGGVLGGVLATTLGLRAPFYCGAAVLGLMAIALAPILTTAALDRAAGKQFVPTKESTP